jgi:hypothetical protein
MNTFKITTILLAVGFAAGMGCGSDSGGGKSDAPVIGGGTGGAAHLDAGGMGGAPGAGGAPGSGGMVGTGGVPMDAPLASGGTSGNLDGGGLDVSMAMDSATMDAPMTALDGARSEAGGGEAAPPTNICTGLSAAACDLAIRNAATDNTVVAQDVPVISATAYPACSQ